MYPIWWHFNTLAITFITHQFCENQQEKWRKNVLQTNYYWLNAVLFELVVNIMWPLHRCFPPLCPLWLLLPLFLIENVTNHYDNDKLPNAVQLQKWFNTLPRKITHIFISAKYLLMLWLNWQLNTSPPINARPHFCEYKKNGLVEQAN